MVRKIVSGGQTGADRAALDAALEAGVEIGGWVPKGRAAEDGTIPSRYSSLRETAAVDPAVRTSLNVRDSDATLILSHGALSGGSLFTRQEAVRLEKPVLHLDLEQLSLPDAIDAALAWLDAIHPEVLNVAGPRSSQDPEIAHAAFALVREVLARLGGNGATAAHGHPGPAPTRCDPGS